MPKTVPSMLVTCILLMSGPAAAQPKFTVHDLGTLGGSTSVANGINNSGQVVGFSAVNNDPLSQHAFRTAANKAIDPATDDLGLLAGSTSVANGVNESGQVVGSANTPSLLPHAFRTAPNGAINPSSDLDTLGTGSAATAINSSGQAAGAVFLGNLTLHAFRTAANKAINLATDELGSLFPAVSPQDTEATGINASGQVVGFSGNGTVNGPTHAFRTSANSPINPATDDLGTLGGAISKALAINNSGQVVGSSLTPSGQTHAFRTAPNSAINAATDDLGTLGGSLSQANAINNSGQVVGSSSTATSQSHAFLYSGAGMSDLNDFIAPNSGWTLSSATGINDAGQIAGTGLLNGAQHAFRLDPAPAPQPPPAGPPSSVAPVLSSLFDAIASFDLPHGTRQELIASLNACMDSLERGNSKAAANELHAFENKVRAQRGKKLTEAQADTLLDLADKAIQMLQ